MELSAHKIFLVFFLLAGFNSKFLKNMSQGKM